jgi:toxin-antitoxin system PIN domain toxin
MKKASSERRPLLLDVNVLLALGWPNHQFHDAIVARLEQRPQPRWATCALTQLGFVRLSCNPAAVGLPKSPAEAVGALGRLVSDRQHVFIGRLPPVVDVATGFTRILGHHQVTDAYLVALARHHAATLLTFDRRIAAAATAPTTVETLAG